MFLKFLRFARLVQWQCFLCFYQPEIWTRKIVAIYDCCQLPVKKWVLSSEIEILSYLFMISDEFLINFVWKLTNKLFQGKKEIVTQFILQDSICK